MAEYQLTYFMSMMYTFKVGIISKDKILNSIEFLL